MRIAVVALLLIGCGNKPSATGDTDAPKADAPTGDGSIDTPIDAGCPLPQAGEVGGPCTTDAQCDSSTGAGDGLCLDITDGGIGWPASGYCTHQTCNLDSDCGSGKLCVAVDDPTGAFNACMPACGASPCECGSGQVCSNSLAASPMDKSACIPGNPPAIDGDPCSGFGECDLDSICRTDALEHPGGQCIQLGCTIGTDSTCSSGGDGHCANPGIVGVTTGCLDACTNDGDCRTTEGYKCFDAGGATGKHCRHPQTGDACAVDTDCGDVVMWECLTGAGFPGGYCTIEPACTPATGAGCSPGSSVCFDPAGTPAPYCVDRCTGGGQGSCRTGYLCTIIGSVSGCI